MAVRAANTDHAIVSFEISFAFSAKMLRSEIVQAIEASYEKIRHELPFRGELDRETGIITFGRFLPNGVPSWLMAVNLRNRYSIVVTSTTYTRWKKMLAQSLILIERLCLAFFESGDEVLLEEIGLIVEDRFLISGEDASFLEVLQADNEFIASRTLASTDAFHSHIGWIDSESRTLSRLNIQSIKGSDMTKNPESAIDIRHEQFCRNLSLKDFEEKSKEEIVKALEDLHNRNKDVMNRILTSNVANMISLNPISPPETKLA
jgi:uncharacterized protein (TIGR04255 family)